jgi:uncharacterized protein
VTLGLEADHEPTTTGGLGMNPRASTTALHLSHSTVVRYVIWVLALGIPTLAVPALTGLPAEPFLLLLVYGVLLGGALVIARRSGTDGIRRLFHGALHWRIGWRNWLLAVAALPTATIAVALATGTFVAPDRWLVEIGNYLFLTFVFGALVVNIFEETAWQGLVQRHLTRRHGPLKAAALTSLPFAAVHLPLSFVGDPAMQQVLIATALLCLLAPAMRFMLGRMDAISGGSLLAVGVMHASVNASGQLGVVNGDWQPIGALLAVTAAFLLIDARRAGVGQQLGAHTIADRMPEKEAAS